MFKGRNDNLAASHNDSSASKIFRVGIAAAPVSTMEVEYDWDWWAPYAREACTLGA